MLTPYDRKQRAAERAAWAARGAADRLAATPAALVIPTVDWDAELAKLTGSPESPA